MAWIESHSVLINHRKLRELARELRLRPSYTMGHLHALWHVALEQQEDGDLSAWSDESIAEYSDFPGDAPQYVRLLQKHKWLDGRIIHDWLDYAGKFLTKKYSTSNRQRLVEIWAIHGREYGGEAVASNKRTVSDTKATLPNQPNQPTKPTPPESGEEVDELGSQVRVFFAEHSKLIHNPRDEAIVKKMVLEGGWGDTKAAFDEAFAQSAGKPVLYAQSVLTNRKAKQRLGKPGEKPYVPPTPENSAPVLHKYAPPPRERKQVTL